MADPTPPDPASSSASVLPEDEVDDQILDDEETERLLQESTRTKKALSRVMPLSQPILEERKRDRFVNVARRAKTSGFAALIHDNTSPRLLANKTWTELMTGLTQAHLKTARMLQSSFRWLLPKDETTTPEELGIFRTLRTNPMLVTTHDLSKVLSLSLSTATSPPTPVGSYNFYVRSWTFKPTELRRLIECMIEEQLILEEMLAWEQVLKLHDNDNGPKYFTIRYIGTVQGPNTPFMRHENDLSGGAAGVLSDFYRVVASLFPEIATAAEIHLIEDATIDWVHSGLLREDVERVLIQAFDPPTLLNRQRGGYYTSYVPSLDDTDLFSALKTNVYERLRAHGHWAKADVIEKLSTHFDDLQAYANENPHLTGTERHTYTDAVKEAAFGQAVPQLQIHNHTILAMLGKDITLEEYLSAGTFLNGKTRAGLLTRDFIMRHAQDEAEANNLAWITKPSILPLIVISFSTPVTSITRANFQHLYGIARNGEAAQLAGDITLQHTGSGFAPHHFINIPMLDPGRDKYGSQDLTLRRVFDLTWTLAFLVASLAIDVMLKYGDDRPDTRKKICEEILSRLEKVKKTKQGKKFFVAFDEAKIALRDHWRQVFTRGTFSEEVHPVLSVTGRRRIADMGLAEGDPDSAERQAHLTKLWNLNIPDLHLTLPHDPDNRDAWFAALTALQPKQSYFLRFLQDSQGDDQKFLERLLQQCPDTRTVYTWLKASESDAAVLKCGLWLHRKRDEDDQRLQRRSFPDDAVPADKMQGRAIGVHGGKGAFRVHWTKPDKSRVDLRFSVAWAAPRLGTDMRFLSFTEHGIDIVDAAGTALRAPPTAAGRVPKASIEKGALVTTEARHVALEFWKAVRKAEGHEVDEEEMEEENAEWPARGVDWVNPQKRGGGETPTQNRPPQQGDANFLLVEFIDQTFPEGGTFRTAAVDRVTDSPDHVNQFVLFCQQPEYRGHPYADNWIAQLTKAPRNVQLFEPNLLPFRRCVKQKKLRATKASTTRVSETIFELGPIGSAEVGAKRGGNLSDTKARRAAKQPEGEDIPGEEEGEEQHEGMEAGPSTSNVGQAKRRKKSQASGEASATERVSPTKMFNPSAPSPQDDPDDPIEIVTEEEAPRKKRGRPPGSKTKSKLSKEVQASDDDEPPEKKQKNKSGRPRKRKSSSPESESKPKQKKPGRPKKVTSQPVKAPARELEEDPIVDESNQ